MPTFGLTISMIDGEPRPATWGDLSILGIIGVAPDADPDVFPYDEPVLVRTSDAAMITALGAAGTLADSLKMVNAQLGELKASALAVVVRVTAGADTAATIANIVGDGALTGVSAFLRAPEELGYTPRLLAAPGFTSQIAEGATGNAVVAALAGICPRLLAHAVVDGPGTTFADAQAWRESINSQRIIPVEPGVRLIDADGDTYTAPLSPAILGVAVRRDAEFEGRPFHSWANQAVQGIVGPSRPVKFSMTDDTTEGQMLLAANVGILTRGELGVDGGIADGGFVFIGTDTAGSDELWRFYNVTRGRDYIHLMCLKTLRTYLGRFNITGQTIQAILNTLRSALNQLKAAGDIIDFKVDFFPDENSPEDLRAGHLTVSFLAEEAPVLRRINIKSGRYRSALEGMIEELATAAS